MRPLAARAQQPDRMRRLGVLFSGATEADMEGQARVAALRLGLLEHGWVEGRNLGIDYRWGGADLSRLRAYAAELMALNPDVILAAPTGALAEVQRATRTIPVVFAQVADPVGAGFVASLAHPGGNITGFAIFEFAVGAKWVEQADCSLCDACRCHLRSCNREFDRLFAIDPGGRPFLRRRCICPQRARHQRDRGRNQRNCGRAEWRPDCIS